VKNIASGSLVDVLLTKLSVISTPGTRQKQGERIQQKGAKREQKGVNTKGGQYQLVNTGTTARGRG
jgi:hypothetical protein